MFQGSTDEPRLLAELFRVLGCIAYISKGLGGECA